MAKNMLAELKGGEVIAALNPLQQFMRLSQLASAYAELDDDGNVKLSTPSNKVDAFMELLEEASGEQVVAFAESKQLIQLVAGELIRQDIPHGLITGDQDAARRQLIVEQFQAGNLRVVLCTSAGAEGITLTSARILVFLQRFWSSIKNKQAADRVHRIGQERGVDIITFATTGTVDEYRETQLADKEVALQEILQDDAIREEMLGWSKRKR
jgi:SNF2 family DNA or RNA helicase